MEYILKIKGINSEMWLVKLNLAESIEIDKKSIYPTCTVHMQKNQNKATSERYCLMRENNEKLHHQPLLRHSQWTRREEKLRMCASQSRLPSTWNT